MKKWEYQLLYYSLETKSESINALGDDGWELISVISSAHDVRLRWIFKREKIEKATAVDGD